MEGDSSKDCSGRNLPRLLMKTKASSYVQLALHPSVTGGVEFYTVVADSTPESEYRKAGSFVDISDIGYVLYTTSTYEISDDMAICEFDNIKINTKDKIVKIAESRDMEGMFDVNIESSPKLGRAAPQ